MKGFKKFMESMCPQTNDNIVFGGDVAEEGGDTRCQRDLEQIVHHLGQSRVQKLELSHWDQNNQDTYHLWSQWVYSISELLYHHQVDPLGAPWAVFCPPQGHLHQSPHSRSWFPEMWCPCHVVRGIIWDWLAIKRAVLALELSVVLDDKVKLEDVIECAYDEVEDADM